MRTAIFVGLMCIADALGAVHDTEMAEFLAMVLFGCIFIDAINIFKKHGV